MIDRLVDRSLETVRRALGIPPMLHHLLASSHLIRLDVRISYCYRRAERQLP